MPNAMLTLICHAATAATRIASFPMDEPLDAAGLAAAGAMAPTVRRVDVALTGPALRARQTAAALGLDAAIDPGLRDLDCGTWAGRSLEEAAASDPQGMAAWMTDSACAPHGGESVDALLARVGDWMGTAAAMEGRIVAVSHAAVVRAAVMVALDAGPRSFWRIEAAPLCRARLRYGPGGWTLLSLGR